MAVFRVLGRKAYRFDVLCFCCVLELKEDDVNEAHCAHFYSVNIDAPRRDTVLEQDFYGKCLCESAPGVRQPQDFSSWVGAGFRFLS